MSHLAGLIAFFAFMGVGAIGWVAGIGYLTTGLAQPFLAPLGLLTLAFAMVGASFTWLNHQTRNQP